jgi:uncharacterized protein YyaL (SSP411 family)
MADQGRMAGMRSAGVENGFEASGRAIEKESFDSVRQGAALLPSYGTEVESAPRRAYTRSMASQNQLGQAASSYLRSAAHQPIHWHEWSEEAFARARKEDKPILLDIGAVWCHWCHVMDRESYEDPQLAELINQHFIAIKVDRDERPDIDSRYQAAVQAMSGQGGWPLTGFLMPNGIPFFGGTYFPPQEHWGRPSFRRVLTAIAEAYQQRRGDVKQQADAILALLSQAESFPASQGQVSDRIVGMITAQALQMFDEENGGFGSAPKFPHPSTVDLLIDCYTRTPTPELHKVITTTLTKMAKGGVYDQLAGGFHRYSVDERWIVPHFEKMSYDNSELLKNYVHGWQATGESLFAQVALDIIRWMDEWLSDRQRGGFYASQDADYSLDDDGNYFTWSMDEARAVLTDDEFKVASLHYDIGEVGEMQHDHTRNVLFVRAELPEIAKRLQITQERASQLLQSTRQKMYAARLRRPTPYVDKTIYVGWNALCVSAYLAAANALPADPRLEDARHFALRSLDRILAEAWGKADKNLRHVIQYSDPQSEPRENAGLLDDYAFATLACVDAYETTADLSYFNFAHEIAEAMAARFLDTQNGGFFDAKTGDGALGALITRRKPFQDTPTPAGNSSAAIALLRLCGYSGEVRYREIAQRTLEVFAGAADQYGLFAATYGMAAQWLLRPHTQVVVIGNDDVAESLYRTAARPFAIGKTVLRFRAAAEVVSQNLPAALGQALPALPAMRDEQSFAVLCSGFTCQPPIRHPEELARAMQSVLAPKK